MSLVQFCEKGDLEGVKAALKRGDDVNTKDEYGWTGLIWTVKWNPYRNTWNHNSVVDLLLNTPNIDVNLTMTSDEHWCLEWSALHWALQANNNEAFKLLLDVPTIDVNVVDDNGLSAVHHAIYGNNIDALKLLLNVPNIDLNIVDNDGYNAVHAAVEAIHFAKERYCSRLGWKVGWASNEKGIERLKLLLSHPSLTALTLNQKGKYNGYTPVMLAMRIKGHGGLGGLEDLVVEVLAADPRVDLDTADNEGLSLAYWEADKLIPM